VLPLLFALGAGKLTMVLGGAGQGQPSSAAWATAYLGPGPWGSLAPSLPSHPSQAYEGVGTLVVLVLAVSVLAARARPSGSPDGRAFFLGVAAWTLVRAAASLTWRDPAVVGPLNAGTLISLGVMASCLGAVGVLVARSRNDATTGTMTTAPPPAPIPQWPDPEERPRF
jgi:prolipoprotein diacylglyceryltransferase